MISYESFKESVVPGIEELVKQKGYEVSRIQTIKKNKKEGLLFQKRPDLVLPLENIHEIYLKCLDELVNNMLNWLESEEASNILDDVVLTKDFILENVTISLINAESNAKQLKEMAHRMYLDLAIIYRVYINQTNIGTKSLIVTNNQMEELGISEEDLYNAALENSSNKYPYEIKDLSGAIKVKMDEEGFVPGIYVPEIDCESEIEDNMLVISNDSGINGASAILYNSVLKNVGEFYGKNYFLFPSSIHEVITVVAGEDKCEELNYYREMVRDINSAVLDPSDVLSNEVYYYDTVTGELNNASDCILTY